MPRLGVEVLEPREVPAVLAWTGEGNDSLWSNAKNWDTKSVPQTGDSVRIDAPGKVVQVLSDVSVMEVLLTSGFLNIGTSRTLTVPFLFTQYGGTVDGAGTLNLKTGHLFGGVQQGTGVTTLLANGEATFSSVNNDTAVFELAGSRTFRIDGKAIQEASANVRLSGASTLRVTAEASYTVDDFAAGTVQRISAGSGSDMRVQIDAGGRFVTNDNDDLFQIDAPVFNRGTIEVTGQSATVTLQGASDLGGTIRIAPTSSFKVNPWTAFSLPGGGVGPATTQLGAAGGLRVESIGAAGGNFSLGNSIQMTGNLVAAAGAFVTVKGTATITGSGSETITVGGESTLTTTGAKFYCVGLSIAANSTWNIEGGTGSTTEFYGVPIANSGTTNWNGSDIVLEAGTTLTNSANATFDIRVGGTLTAAPFTDIANAGLLRVATTEDKQVVTIGARILNTGTLEVGSDSTLHVNVTKSAIGAGRQAGIVSTQGSIVLASGATLRSRDIFVGGGELTYKIGSIVDVDSTFTVDAGTLRSAVGIGALDVRCNLFTLGANAKVKIQARAANQYDTISVNGPMSIGGTLEFAAIDGYEPAAGDVVKWLTFPFTAQGSGKFAAVTGVAADNVKYNPTDNSIVWTNAQETDRR